jgi:hypothetical protein
MVQAQRGMRARLVFQVDDVVGNERLDHAELGTSALLMRGLEKVRAEFSLTALAYNLRRAITIIGVPGLIRAVQA